MATNDGELLVVMDVGNSNTVVGVYRGEELAAHLRLTTDRERTADEYGALILPLLGRQGVDPSHARAVVISSVVPPLRLTLEWLSERFFDCEPIFVEAGSESGLVVRYRPPADVGADRIVNAVAARHLFGTPVVVVDFGTATTFDVIDESGDYVGGIIAPGLEISAEALFARASRLYRVDLRQPAKLVGENTSGAMQSGLYFGYVGLVDGILERLHRELPGLKRVVATGGQARLIAGGSQYIQDVREDLTLIGLKLIYERRGSARDRGA